MFNEQNLINLNTGCFLNIILTSTSQQIGSSQVFKLFRKFWARFQDIAIGNMVICNDWNKDMSFFGFKCPKDFA